MQAEDPAINLQDGLTGLIHDYGIFAEVENLLTNNVAHSNIHLPRLMSDTRSSCDERVSPKVQIMVRVRLYVKASVARLRIYAPIIL